MRRHGLQMPLDPHQLASWLVFFALASGVYAFYMPFVEDAGVRWFLVALYSVLVVAIVALDLYTSYLDPSDPGLTGATDGEFFCGLCQASVARSSKHCRACDRCVEGFDHHCKWLNNCVGARNYWHFFVLISSTVSLLVLQLAWGLWLFIRSFTEKSEMRVLVADKYGKSVVYGGWQAALAIYMVLLVAAVVMLGELLFFHMVLISKGLTTYDYIIAQRDAKLAAPPRSSSNNIKACRSSKVADTTTAKRKVRVGLNPCAAMRTSKPMGSHASYDAAKGGKANSGRGIAADVTAPTTSPVSLGKQALKGVGSGSVDSTSSDGKDGLGVSGKAISAGGVRDFVPRAVAEQTVCKRPSLRQAAVLRGLPGAGGGPAFGGPGGCVPECSNTASEGGAFSSDRASSSPLQEEFTTLEMGKELYSNPGIVPAASAAAGPSGTLYDCAGSLRGAPGGANGSAAGRGSVDGAQPSGRHLGGHPSSSPGVLSPKAAGPEPGVPSFPLVRAVSLPPLISAPGLPGPVVPGGPGSRSLLYPTQSKSPRGSGTGSRVQLPITPE
ncbi:hypothetical protein Vafri_66 [Volvox africanus]|nr:hypothetical protein Vafri_66 [Volvox africanus]